MVVSGRPGMFSAGLDVPELIELDRGQMERFWRNFVSMLGQIASMPVPTVFALTGHAPAGGIVMALFGDYRFTGTYKQHPDPNQEQFFFGLLRECLDAGLVTEAMLQDEMARNHIRHDALDILRQAANLAA